MSDFDQWVADSGLVAHRRFDDGTVAAIIPLVMGTWRLVIGPELKGWIDDMY